MKKTRSLLTLLLLAGTAAGQTSAVSVLQNELVKSLQSEGILLKDQQKSCTGDCRPACPWKNDRQRTKAIQQDSQLMNYLVGHFNPPTFCRRAKCPAKFQLLELKPYPYRQIPDQKWRPKRHQYPKPTIGNLEYQSDQYPITRGRGKYVSA
ncbi:hypothetical protein ACQ86K_11450 [Mucilaginibacter sp. P19]|uniref:hypothetical protein n=1 Tax=Mucilaginibacter sp. P19 TaxID=3423947 RepID=UPI003D6754E8